MQERTRRRFRATVHYDGSRFHGWQVQPDRRTVQGAVENALQRLFPDPVRVTAAGRTDAGVHAVGQEIAYPAPGGWTAPEMRRALNAVLPDDVWIEKLGEAPEKFHPRFDATARRYVYLVGTSEASASPLRGERVWSLARPLDEDLLRDRAALLPGERSFEAFAKAGQESRGTRCRVERAEWRRTVLDDLAFTIVADRFLHHMVRYLVEVLVNTARGERPADDLESLLAGRGDPRPPGPAPAEGLYMDAVRYPDGWNRPGGIPGLTGPPDGRRGAADADAPDGRAADGEPDARGEP